MDLPTLFFYAVMIMLCSVAFVIGCLLVILIWQVLWRD